MFRIEGKIESAVPNLERSYRDIADPALREEKFDRATELRRVRAIRAHAHECYRVLIEPDPAKPDQKTFGDLLVALFRPMHPGECRRFLSMSGNHAMFLELVKKQAGTKELLVAHYFEPNYTDVHKHVQTDLPEVVKNEWSATALLRNDLDRQVYWPSGTRHAMIGEIKDWPDPNCIRPIEKNRAVHSLEYTDAPASSKVLQYLASFSMHDTFRAQLGMLDPEERRSRLSEPDSKGTTPLHIACQEGLTEIVNIIQSTVERKAFAALLNVKAARGTTPLGQACQEGHTEIVEIIASNVSSDEFLALLNIADRHGATPLLRACQNGRTGIVKMIARAVPSKELAALLRNSGNKDVTALCLACENGHVEIVDSIASALQADDFAELLKKQDSYGTTPFYMACKNGHTAIVAIVASKVPDELAALLNMSDKHVPPPLHMICQKGHTRLVQMILGALPELEANALLTCEYKGWTPLAVAVAARKRSIVEAIDAYGNEHPDIGGLLTKNRREQA